MIFTLDNLSHALVSAAFTSLMFYFTLPFYPYSWIVIPVVVSAFYIREAGQKDWRFSGWKMGKHMEWIVPSVVSFITGGLWSWFGA